MVNDKIEEIIIYQDKTNNIFKTDKPYIIPLYQRAFAWEEKQLIQLLEDIKDSCTGSKKYYIGSLIVADKESYFEVIDGQQRLTALFILLHCLKAKVDNTLSFACRDKSNYTLGNLDLILSASNMVDDKKIQESIKKGVDIIRNELSNSEGYGPDFLAKLSRVIMYRIVVPPHTDLNHYFEVMNTRGEQLEQHDILKANLMSFLQGDDAYMDVFAEIWNACSEMDGYVQMNFCKESREWLFYGRWDKIPKSNYLDEYVNHVRESGIKRSDNYISDIIKPNFKNNTTRRNEESDVGKDSQRRFESIIDFPYFLLHCLKTYVQSRALVSDDKKELCDSLLNDKKLGLSFDRVIRHGLFKGKHLDEAFFSKDFILHLLQMRYLFDQYIIKREYIGQSSEGHWSLETLAVSGQDGSKKAYYKKTSFLGYYQRKEKFDELHKDNLMIQSSLRVSYTSPKVMHWITKLLLWLGEREDGEFNNLYSLNVFSKIAEQIARDSISDQIYHNFDTDGVYKLGTKTPHIVFNYLDFLIWKKEKNKYDDFSFEFRNSVEHWYPRHPSESEIKIWGDEDGSVDRFGNLCIIQRDVNSKFSNLPPEGKKTSYNNRIANGSLKLRIMSEKTVPCKGISANQNWKEKACKEHEKEMIDLLKEACGIN